MKSYFRSLAVSLSTLIAFSAAAHGQTANGRIVGRVLDNETGQPLSGAQVAIVGAKIGGLSGVDGRYSIAGVTPGTYALQVTYIGRAQKTVEGVVVPANGTVQQDVALVSSAIQLTAVT